MSIRRALFLVVFVFCCATRAFAGSYPADVNLQIMRFYPTQPVPLEQPATAIVFFMTLESDDLRGLYYSEQFPEWISVHTAGVTLNGVPISYLYEAGVPGEPISEWISHRWIIGDPADGGELALTMGDVLTLQFYLTSTATGAITMEHDGWFGLLGDLPVFGSDDIAPQVIFANEGGTPVPPSAAEGIVFEHAFPNPFNPSTRLGFSLSGDRRVTIDIFDQSGRKLRRLVEEDYSAGRHDVVWDGRDGAGVALPSGIYLALLRSGDDALLSNKLVLVK